MYKIYKTGKSSIHKQSKLISGDWMKLIMFPRRILLLLILQIAACLAETKESNEAEEKLFGLENIFKQSNAKLAIKTMDQENSNFIGKATVTFTSVNNQSTTPYDTSSIVFPDIFLASTNFTYNMVIDESLDHINHLKIRPGAFFSNLPWRPQLVQVKRNSDGDISFFPIVRTLRSNQEYAYYEFDTLLPQEDPNIAQRGRDLEDNKKKYAFQENSNYDGTPMLKSLPFDEAFPLHYAVRIGLKAVLDVVKTIPGKITFRKSWHSYKDMREIFNIHRKPLYLNIDPASDEWFGRQRLEGINPAIIKLCKKIPSNFAVTDDLVRGLMDKHTIKSAIKAKKLFIVNLEIMKDIRTKFDANVGAPMALFYLNKDNNLVPVAIQLLQEKSSTNPVFTPKDNKNIWQLAKFNYQNADSQHHQSITHLGNAHLLLEAVLGCTYQELAPSHPIFRLLRPHFLSTAAINKLAMLILVSKGGAIDATMSITGPGMFYLAGLGLQDFNMTRDALLPDMFEIAGVTKKTLPDYKFRDDFSLIYEKIKKYVTSIVKLYYVNDASVRKDIEINNFRRKLTASSAPGKDRGLGLKGVPGDDQKGFRNRKELIDVLTAFISTASVKHAAVNFMQYDWYAFAANAPAYIEGPFPTSKVNSSITDDYVLDQLTSRNRLMDLITVVDLLSTKLTNLLGKFEVPMFYAPKAKAIVKQFQDDIADAQNIIAERNTKRERKYPWCSGAPNAISI